VSSPVAPGEVVTLTASEFVTDYSQWEGNFTSGDHTLYVYVDSWGDSEFTASSQESNENNNRLGPVTVQVTGDSRSHFSLGDWLRMLLPRPRRP